MTQHQWPLGLRIGPSLLVAVMVLLVFPGVAWSQTAAATSTVLGTVTDPQGAVVPGAEVELINTATNRVRKQITNEAGQYTFTAVLPGVYKLTVTAQGFRQAVITSLKVDVAKSYTVDVTLEVGEMVETVEVTAGAAVELQKTDSTVGDVIGGRELLFLPTVDRSAASLLLLQPMVAPGGTAVSNISGGQVAGARSDQSTFLLDGGDATNDTEGTGGYQTRQWHGAPLPVVPVPVESVEEFRVSTTNPNATFGRSMGGQISLVTKRGTNEIHGSAYWYHQNDNLNANTWDLNRTGVKKPELKDNRFGFSLGGPILKNRTFLFGHYEGRRFPRSGTIVRLVPTDTLRNGILRFRDASGNIVSYDLATSTLCGDGTQACDPRGVGISPVVRALWNLLPPGNDPSVGDGLNTIGFRATAPAPLNTDFFVLRLDQEISNTWNMYVTYRFFHRELPDLSQIDIGGLVSGKPGEAVPVGSSPYEPRYVVAGLNGQLTPRLTSEFRFSWARNFWAWQRVDPFPQVSGTAAALQLAGEPGLVDEPINIDTQRARSRAWNGHDLYFAENLTWVKGNHTMQFGFSFRKNQIHHFRTDKVTGGLAGGPIYWLDDGSAVTIPTDFRPPTCSEDITTNCLQSGDLSRWNKLYAATLGMVDKAAQVLTRDGQLNPQPLGAVAQANSSIKAWEFYLQDVWRVHPSFTFTYGLTYQVQIPPLEEQGRQMVVVFKDSAQPLFIDQYFERRREAALRGEIYNPEIAYSPVRAAGRKYPYDIDWDNFGPRVSAAWNPSFTEGFWGRLFGDRKTVFRGGYGLTYTRMNGVQLVMVPLLGVGLMQILTCSGPDITGACTGSTDPTNAFRIGVDGSLVALPAPAPAEIPFPVASPWFLGEIRSFMMDPGFKLGYSHSFDFTIQRELPGNMLLELGYVGRLGRNLTQPVDMNAVPFFQLDPLSGQTLAQAFDAVAEQLRAGVDPSAVTPQPWFENQVGAGATASLAGDFQTEFINGDLASIFLFGIDIDRALNGLTPFVNMQVLVNSFTGDGGRSNYHAAFISLRKRMSHGLTFGLNYTFSHALDQFGLNQEYISGMLSPFDFDLDYASAPYDRRHTLNVHWYYELPFGRGRRFSTGNWADKLFGGWFTAGIFNAMSGLPLCVWTGGGNYGAFLGGACAVPTREPSFGNSVHSGVAGSGNIGTNGDPAAGGSGLNLFANPEQVFHSFRQMLLSRDRKTGYGTLRGLPRWGLDLTLGKRTMVSETVGITLTFDFLNIFNHVEFDNPDTDLTNPRAFGVLTSQWNQPRRIQVGFRVEF